MNSSIKKWADFDGTWSDYKLYLHSKSALSHKLDNYTQAPPEANLQRSFYETEGN